MINPGPASYILALRMMFPAAGFVLLQLLPPEGLLPDPPRALGISRGAEGGAGIGLLLRVIPFALHATRRRACAALLRLGRTLPLERRFVAFHAVRRPRILGGMLTGDVHSEAVPGVEGFAAVLTARARSKTRFFAVDDGEQRTWR